MQPLYIVMYKDFPQPVSFTVEGSVLGPFLYTDEKKAKSPFFGEFQEEDKSRGYTYLKIEGESVLLSILTQFTPVNVDIVSINDHMIPVTPKGAETVNEIEDLEAWKKVFLDRPEDKDTPPLWAMYIVKAVEQAMGVNIKPTFTEKTIDLMQNRMTSKVIQHYVSFVNGIPKNGKTTVYTQGLEKLGLPEIMIREVPVLFSSTPVKRVIKEIVRLMLDQPEVLDSEDSAFSIDGTQFFTLEKRGSVLEVVTMNQPNFVFDDSGLLN